MSEEELLDAMCQVYWRAGPGIRNSMRSILELLHANGYRRCAEGQRAAIQATHWDDCWKSGPEHYECAVGEVERLRARDEEWQRKASAWMASPEAAQRLEGYRELTRKLNDAEAEVERLRADAERYRWLRDVATGDQWDYIMTTEDTDAAIDAARGES